MRKLPEIGANKPIEWEIFYQNQVKYRFKSVGYEYFRVDYLIDALWHCQRLGLLAHQALARFDPQIELQVLVYAVHPLVVPFEALDVAQIQVTQAKAPAAVVVR
jgi:hypothetical protein